MIDGAVAIAGCGAVVWRRLIQFKAAAAAPSGPARHYRAAGEGSAWWNAGRFVCFACLWRIGAPATVHTAAAIAKEAKTVANRLRVGVIVFGRRFSNNAAISAARRRWAACQTSAVSFLIGSRSMGGISCKAPR
jgi:hypothetical protein